jgi:hypothetical protein
VAFPAMTASDTGAVPTPTVTCTGEFKPGGTLAYSVGAAALFPVGVTEVSCVARDAANNPSKPVKFTVKVACPTGYNVTAGPAGVCKGVAPLTRRQSNIPSPPIQQLYFPLITPLPPSSQTELAMHRGCSGIRNQECICFTHTFSLTFKSPHLADQM